MCLFPASPLGPPGIGVSKDGGLLAVQDAGEKLPQGRVPPGTSLFYEVELLRCQSFPVGLACCPDEKYPCIPKGEEGLLEVVK